MANSGILSTLTLLALFILSCHHEPQEISITDEDGVNNCLNLKGIVQNHHIESIQITRPLGHTIDTTQYHLADMQHLYGKRLFTLANEKFQCRDIDSIVFIEDKTLRINLVVAGYNLSGPFTQDFVTNYWESDNGYLSNKTLPSFKGQSFGEGMTDLDSLIKESEKSLLHFGWLSCQGCMIEQSEIVRMKSDHPDIQFINITIDQADRLNKYLVDKGDYFVLRPPYNRYSDSMVKPILFDQRKNIFEYFHLDGLFPVNFLVDQSGTVEKVGRLMEIFSTRQGLF